MERQQLTRYKTMVELAKKSDALQDGALVKRLKLLGINWDEKEAQELEKIVLARKSRKDISGKPFLTPRKGEIEGDLAGVGFVDEEKIFGLTEERCRMHILITGQSRIGKTTAIYLIISGLSKTKKFLIIDFKRDYRGLVRIVEDTLVLRWSDLKLNPLAPPPFVQPREWMQIFSDLFSQAFGLLHGSNFYLQEKVDELYQIYGVYEGSSIYPSLFDLAELLESKGASSRVAKDYQERVKNRVKETVRTLDKVLDCSLGYPLEELLLENNVVLELDGLSRALSVFLVNYLLYWIFTYRINASERGGKVKNIIVVDEAKRIFDKNLEKLPVEGIPIITTLTSQIGEFNVGLIVGEQTPSMLTDGIKANVGTTISFRLSNGKDIQEMAKAMNLKKEEKEYLSKLEVGETVVRTIGADEPFLMKVPDISAMIEKNISNEELSFSKRPLLQFPTTGRVSLSELLGTLKPERQSLSADELIFLADVVNHFEVSFTARTKGLGMTNYMTNHIKKSLLEKGLIREESIKLKSGRGKPELFLELTPDGFKVLGVKTRHQGKGGLFHRLAQELISNYYRKRDWAVEKEKLVEGRLIDVVVVSPDNKAIPIEVETGQSNYLETVEFNLAVFGVVMVVTPAEEKTKETIERNILRNLEENNRKRVIFRTITFYGDDQDNEK